MAMIKGKKVFRNLQEQVQYNSDCINDLMEAKGYKGPYETLNDIPSTDLINYGLYLVGTSSPYSLYEYHSDTENFTLLGNFPGAQGPQGEPGQDGQDGQDGAAAGFGTPTATATTLQPTDNATVSVEASGPNTAKIFAFTFGIPKGAKGDKGDKGDPGSAVPDWSNLQEQEITNRYTYSNDYEQYFSTAQRFLAEYSKPYNAPATGGGTYQTDEESVIQALNDEISISNRIGNGSEDYNMYAAFKIKDGVASYVTQVIKDAENLHPGNLTFTFPTSEELMDYPNISKIYGKIATTADAGYVTYWKLGANDSMPNYIYVTDAATHTIITEDYKTAFGSDRAAFIVEKTNNDGDVDVKVYRKIARYKDDTTGQSKHYFQSIGKYDSNSTEINVDIMIFDDTPITDPEHPSIMYNYYAVSYASKSINLATLATVATTGSYNDLLNKPTIPTKTSDLTNDSGFISSITSQMIASALGYTPGTSNFSGSYNDLTDKPTIPTKTSDLTNDSGFISSITSQMIATALGYTPGTSNFSGSYNDLTDKPTIPTKTSDLQNDSGYITSVSWNDILSKPTFATVATSGDYNDLLNKPTIPTKVSDLTNDSGFITGITSTMIKNALSYTPLQELGSTDGSTYIADLNVGGTGLTSYGSHLSVSGYSGGVAKLLTADAIQFLINQAIGSVSTISLQVVQTLPTQDIQTNVIYLVPRNPGETNDVYNEYVYVNNNWELIGNTTVDLSNYYTKTEVNGLIPTTASSTSVVTPTTSAFVTGTTKTTETLTFTYSDNTTANITVVTSVTDNTSNAMTGATVATTTTIS